MTRYMITLYDTVYDSSDIVMINGNLLFNSVIQSIELRYYTLKEWNETYIFNRKTMFHENENTNTEIGNNYVS